MLTLYPGVEEPTTQLILFLCHTISFQSSFIEVRDNRAEERGERREERGERREERRRGEESRAEERGEGADIVTYEVGNSE